MKLAPAMSAAEAPGSAVAAPGSEAATPGPEACIFFPCRATPGPEAANLLHASFGSDLQLGSQTWSWGIEGHNLLNTVYRDYTSLLRYYADQPGRDVRLHVSTDF